MIDGKTERQMQKHKRRIFDAKIATKTNYHDSDTLFSFFFLKARELLVVENVCVCVCVSWPHPIVRSENSSGLLLTSLTLTPAHPLA